MDYNSLSGLDKAAVLFQVLGEPLAVSFFTGLAKEDILKIRVRSTELAGKVPTIVKKQILDEYSFLMLQDRYRQSKPDSIKLFEFLDNLNFEEIYYLLSKEKPVVAALAIDQVSDEIGTKFLANFSGYEIFPSDIKIIEKVINYYISKFVFKKETSDCKFFDDDEFLPQKKGARYKFKK